MGEAIPGRVTPRRDDNLGKRQGLSPAVLGGALTQLGGTLPGGPPAQAVRGCDRLADILGMAEANSTQLAQLRTRFLKPPMPSCRKRTMKPIRTG